MSDDAAREIKRALVDPGDVCNKLGLLAGKGSFTRQGGGLLIRCPVHDDRTPSCSVQVKSGVLLWNCHACDKAGDVLTLIAAVHGLTMDGDDFRQVLIAGAELAGLHGLVSDLSADGRRELPNPRPRPEPTQPAERDYPPEAEVAALWANAAPIGPVERVWCESRGLDPDLVSEFVRGLPEGALPRWASYRGSSWRDTGHRAVLPVYDAAGAMRSVRAIRVTDGNSPKRLPPGGHKAAGLVMACDFALAMLRGTRAPDRVLIVEGEPDFLFASSMRTRHAYARIGITSGSWTKELAARIPARAKVILATHNDQAGEKYAKEIEATLPTQALMRWRPDVGGVSGADIADRGKAGTLPKDPEDEAIAIDRPKIPRMADAFQAAGRLLSKGPPVNPMRTGFDELDAGLKRMGGKEFTMLAADSGIGKSTISTQIALHVGASGLGVAYLNLEMSEEMYGLRTASNFVRVATQKAASLELSSEEFQRLTMGFSTLYEPAKHIALGNRKEHRAIPAIKKFCEDAARQLADEGTPLKLIIIDHILQVLVTGSRNDKDVEGKARSDLLKDLAESLDVHVLALVHVTREAAKSGSMPTKNHLASTAWFDRDPDNILVFHQKRREDGTFDAGTPAKLSCQKARWGEPFAVELEYQKGFFYPWSLYPRGRAPAMAPDPNRNPSRQYVAPPGRFDEEDT